MFVQTGGILLLTHKQLETHVCVLSTMATDALVLKHRAISIHNPDGIFIVLDQFHAKHYIHNLWNKNKFIFTKKKLIQLFKN